MTLLPGYDQQGFEGSFGKVNLAEGTFPVLTRVFKSCGERERRANQPPPVIPAPSGSVFGPPFISAFPSRQRISMLYLHKLKSLGEIF